MIEYLLIFALGFCASTLLALVVVPAVCRRVVTLTERRMRATVALTAAEVRAEKDAARARNAAENSRLTALLKQEREGLGAATIERERLGMELARAREAQAELDRRVRELVENGRALDTQLQEQFGRAKEIEAALDAARQLAATKDGYINDLTARAELLAGSVEQARADIALRDSHAGMMRGRIERLQEERAVLRAQIKAATDAARELEIRLGNEQARARSLDEKLAARIVELSDREGALEKAARATQDLGRRLAAGTEELSAARAALQSRDSEIGNLERRLAQQTEAARKAEERCLELERNISGLRPESRRGWDTDFARARPQQEKATTMNGQSHDNSAIARRIERLRKRHARLVGTLPEAGNGENDARLREEIAEIAAMMIDLTAAREGPSSPIHGILAKPAPEHDEGGSPGLAERARRHMEASADTD